ncbi:hypothetical protein WN48_03855, partial [Eufriesea mexicana]
ALVVACALVLIERANAESAENSTQATKRVKEPKEIKETATASKDVKAAIDNAKKNKKDCVNECDYEHDPICVHDPNDESFKPRTFANECLLDVYNCATGTKLAIKNKGECPGSGGVRL